jgi:hypothetical protein
MEGDRRYKQPGYMSGQSENGAARREDRPKPQGPKPPIDVTGPRLPRLVQAVAASRCYNCATALPPDVDFRGNCPKCNAALHCCKQCAYFEPSTRFQCLKPVPVRIAGKDQANECDLFKARVTVARDSASPQPAASGGSSQGAPPAPAPRSADDARTAFENLFKK